MNNVKAISGTVLVMRCVLWNRKLSAADQAELCKLVFVPRSVDVEIGSVAAHGAKSVFAGGLAVLDEEGATVIASVLKSHNKVSPVRDSVLWYSLSGAGPTQVLSFSDAVARRFLSLEQVYTRMGCTSNA